MNPELHAFFLDPSASGHFLHAELSQAYRAAYEQAGGQHELMAYADEFDFLLEEIREYLNDEAEHHLYPEYVTNLANLRTALRAIDARRAEVSDLQIEVGQRLDEFRNLLADAYIRPGQPIDDYGYESWSEARDRTVAHIEGLRSNPEIVPHLDHALTNLDELVNAVPSDIQISDLVYFTTPNDPALHAFFLDPDSSSHRLHADISARYIQLCSQVEGELDLVAYTDGFMDFFNYIRAHQQHADPEDRYTARLTQLWATVYAVFHRSTRVQDLDDTITDDLRSFRNAEAAAARDEIPLTESPSYEHWIMQLSTGIETADRYAAFPLLQPHIDREFSSLADLRNTVAVHAPLARHDATAEAAAEATSPQTPAPNETPAVAPAADPVLQSHAEPATAQVPRYDRPLVWAGIGSRGTGKEPVPQSMFADMTELARRMAAAGWHLSSGGADGSDTAFANGTPVDQRTIWLPWPGYNDLSGPDCHPIPRNRLQQSLELAERFHPAWDICSQGSRKLHARNGLILLGRDLDRPVDAVVAYTKGGKVDGGTGQGLRIAMERGVPIFNLGSMTMEEAWEKLQELQRSLRPDTAARSAPETGRKEAAAQAASRSYDADTACVFRFSRDEWGVFSNFYPSIQAIDAAGHTFKTSEHLYQAAKFRGSPDVQARIAAASSAREAATMGRDTANTPDADWNGRRMNAMRWVIRMKREANPELVDAALQKTGDRPIVEFSRRDSFWGAQRTGNALVGQNILGRLWMELRQHIRDGDPRALASAWEDPLTPKAVARAPAAQTAEADLPASLGLVTTHRRLLEAAQDGWLHPVEGRAFLLARDGAVSEGLSAGDHPIHLRLTFDPRKFPFPALRAELARAAAGDGPDAALSWRAPIPLFAVTKIEVGTEQDRARLLALAGQFGNVALPAAEIVSTGDPIAAAAHGPAISSDIPALQLPERLNAVQGALAMAVWALPKEERWSPVRQNLLHDHGSKADRITPDWFALPWDSAKTAMPSRPATADQRRLWDAAVSCLQWPGAEGRSPAALAMDIARAASAGAPNPVAQPWLEQTQKIISAEETIAYGGSTDERAGLAIQLALLRPDPDRFQSWPEAMPELPQSVVWAGAALCGWRHGYHNLDNAFRGDTPLQETIATRALANTLPSACAPAWAAAHEDPATVADTWQRIKADYASLYAASGDRIHHLPYQEGFAGFRDLVAGAVRDASCPPEHRDRLTALHETLETQASRHDTVIDAANRLDDAFSRLQDLKEKADAEQGHTIETMPGYTAWLRDRDAAVARWHELAADPAREELKEHMHIVAPDMMAARIAELSNGPLASIHQPRADTPVPSPGQDVYTPSLQPLSQVYDRAMAFVDRDPNLLPYAPQFDELKAALSTALDECSHTPDLMIKLTGLRTALDENQEHKNRAEAVTESVSRASHDLCSMKTWATQAGRPVHEAPRFKTWREEADRALQDYDAAATTPGLAVHLARADRLGVLTETAVPMLRDDRFREPVAARASMAASRQRSEQAEEQYSMSA